MLRTIAKIWIQGCYDRAKKNDRTTVQLPKLLRMWIAADPRLQQYEQSSLKLNTRLSNAALREVPELQLGRMHRPTIQATVRRAPTKTFSPPRFLVFASVLGLAVLLGWFGNWSYRRQKDRLDIAKQDRSNASNVSKEESRVLVASTMDATKQIASRIATKSMALHSKWDELEHSPVIQAQDTAKRGIRFVTQKIPASAAKAFFSTKSR